MTNKGIQYQGETFWVFELEISIFYTALFSWLILCCWYFFICFFFFFFFAVFIYFLLLLLFFLLLFFFFFFWGGGGDGKEGDILFVVVFSVITCEWCCMQIFFFKFLQLTSYEGASKSLCQYLLTKCKSCVLKIAR